MENYIEFGDAREVLKTWKDQDVKVQTCITSPPYYGLRDYGVDGQIGLEQTPDVYVAALVDVFRCVRDVLADDGTLWLNIGDSYWSNIATQGRNEDKSVGSMTGGTAKLIAGGSRTYKRQFVEGLKQKDLIGIPWMLAFALQADGWYLRSDIIWHKPNPMPESVTDRPTKAHEYIFLLSKRPRYYYDHEAVKEPGSTNSHGGGRSGNQKKNVIGGNSGLMNAKPAGDNGRNRRSVWTVTPRPYKGAHFAVFPPQLIEPCVLAGSRPGDIVLDPFMGSGTTAAVALQHGRRYLGVELNPAYKELQEERIKKGI